MSRTIFIVVGIILAAGVFLFYTRPTYDGIQTTRAEIAQYDLALDKATELQRIKQDLLQKYNNFNPSDKDRLQKMLPDHVDNIALILDLDTIAAHHSMTLENVDVSAPVPATVTTPGQINATTQSTSQKYDSLNMKFTVHATYANFLAFMNDLETSLRIVDLVNLSIERGVATAGSAPVYQYNVAIRTYWLK